MPVLMYALIAVGYILFLAVAILLVQTYRRTRATGFIWLVAVLVWPLIGGAIERAVSGPIAHFSQQILSLVLLLTAALALRKTTRTVYN